MSQEKRSDKPSRRHKQPDFSKVGGLSNHIQILRDIIIVPLLHNNIYSFFNIKTPRGILFYGPPGTGKTLVAGALATEINKEGLGKVAFYQRKGADVLDKWVGESEKKLRSLFEMATKTRPSIIFFDELDGLAPMRSAKNDHVHCSLVTTLLALMDGLDSVPGVIVIGATNRIESVDLALRRPGRFDRELYFPLPSTEARKEILQVHMQSWNHKPSPQFVTHLADITTGFCGSDIQALCTETLLCSMKRLYPNIERGPVSGGPRIKIEADSIKFEEVDFLNARKNLVPSSQKSPSNIRKLSPVIAPLLQRQLDNILERVRLLWPHFFIQFHKYVIGGSERYVGKMVLVGSNVQGLGCHLLPAILQSFEHLPIQTMDAECFRTKSALGSLCQNLPSILIIPRIDELWTFLEVHEQNYVTSFLESLHAGLPILIITTCDMELPLMLRNFFYNNTSIVVSIEDPTEEEVGVFFAPLFFNESASLSSVITKTKLKSCGRKATRQFPLTSNIYKLRRPGKVSKPSQSSTVIPLNHLLEATTLEKATASSNALCIFRKESWRKSLSSILADLMKRSSRLENRQTNQRVVQENRFYRAYGDSNDVNKQEVYRLWKKTCCKTAKPMPLVHLEVLYDTIVACINLHKDNFESLVENLEETLNDIEVNNQSS